MANGEDYTTANRGCAAGQYVDAAILLEKNFDDVQREARSRAIQSLSSENPPIARCETQSGQSPADGL